MRLTIILWSSLTFLAINQQGFQNSGRYKNTGCPTHLLWFRSTFHVVCVMYAIPMHRSEILDSLWTLTLYVILNLVLYLCVNGTNWSVSWANREPSVSNEYRRLWCWEVSYCWLNSDDEQFGNSWRLCLDDDNLFFKFWLDCATLINVPHLYQIQIVCHCAGFVHR